MRASAVGVQPDAAGLGRELAVDAAGGDTTKVTFTDCNTAHVDWTTNVAGFTNGGLDLTRLTQPSTS